MPGRPQDIAIIGISALFPGSADLGSFWTDLLAGTDRISDVPPEKWLIDDYYDPDPSVPDKTYAHRGGFLPEVDFDTLSFGLPPKQLEATDTAQLLALLVAQRVLEDATSGSFSQADRSRTSVILGVTSAQELLLDVTSRLQRPVWLKSLRDAGVPETKAQEVCDRIAAHYVPWQEATFPGLLGNVVAGRIANRLDLGGSNFVVDAACASSLSAMAMGIAELRLGTSDLVITGGVDTMTDIFMYMCFSKTPALSKSGDCRPFSDKADGTLLGEGIGMVALKRLEDAERDQDRIYAVIKGVGSSSDGRALSVYAPSSEGQATALRRAYAQAGYEPETVGLVEAHGTGTVAGDAAEFGGLRMVFEKAPLQGVALGSVKSQIGHTKAAAGIAGLIKCVMALHHRVLPPTIKVERPNPALEIERSPFYLNTRARPWISSINRPRRASVSAMGFGGSNFHATVEAWSGARRPRLRSLPSELVIVTGGSPAEVAAEARRLASAGGPLRWHAWRTQTGSDARAPARLAVVAHDESELGIRLGQAAEEIDRRKAPFILPGGVSFGMGAPLGGLAFLFPGQGSQYLDMGAALAMHYDLARDPWDQAAGLSAFEGRPLHEVVFPRSVFDDTARAAQEARLRATEWAQPALAAMSMSILNLLRALELVPDAVGGHSFGEVSALAAAGAFDFEALMRIARGRGELMAQAATTDGAMLAVPYPADELDNLLHKWNSPLVAANLNSPAQTVLSGATADIEDATRRLAELGVTARVLPVSTAFHSPIVSSAVEPFLAFLNTIPMGAPMLPAYANTSAAPHPADPARIREALARQIALPVRFVEQTRAMAAQGIRTFVEVGPGAVLTRLVDQILGDEEHVSIALDQKGKGIDAFHEGLGRLFTSGHTLALKALWREYEAPADPATLVKPRMSVRVSGANIGRPYPPKGGTAALPKPVPEPVQIKEVRMKPVETQPAPQLSPSRQQAASRPAASAPSDDAWLAAYTETQRQTTDAHLAYQRAMSEAHGAFLRVAEAGLNGLARWGTEPGLSPLVSKVSPILSPPTPEPLQVAPTMPAPIPVIKEAPPSEPAPAAVPSPTALPLLAVVAEKTGYPAEMLTLDMSMEGDLGIDSIKRVEILSALRERIPGLPQLSSSSLTGDKTLGELAALLGVNAEPQPEPAKTDTAGSSLSGDLLAVVAEKTGYPCEMLTLDMSMEGDLGIDSIKRVEILSGLRERIPGLPQLPASSLTGDKTLGEVASLLGASPVESQARVLTPKESEGPSASAQLLSVVAEKTGYPAEMLTLDMSMEGDLGIDSIKRVEILSALRERLPGLPHLSSASLTGDKTLGELVVLLGAAPAPSKGLPPITAPSQAPAPAVDDLLGRFVVEAVEEAAIGMVRPGVFDAGLLHVTRDTLGVGSALVELLRARGLNASLCEELPDQASHLIFTLGLEPMKDIEQALALNRQAFQAARVVGAQASPGLLVMVQDTGGRFAPTDDRAYTAGLAALARTADLEWPLVTARAIDLEVGDRPAELLARALRDELLAGGPEPSVGLCADGRRFVLQDREQPVRPSVPRLGPSDVIVVSGGARGVTAATIIALARDTRARFLLLGRTHLQEEPALCRGLVEASAIQRALMPIAGATPLRLQAMARDVLANREVQGTLSAIEAAGGRARYLSVDVTDTASLTLALEQARADWGPITALIHGAGVLADKLIVDKTEAQFDHVFDTKVRGLLALLDATRNDPLRVLLLFSSVSARHGNLGQADYAMANEILNKVARVEASRRPGLLSRALGWGPWAGGMVSPELAARFTSLGVALLPLEGGALRLVAEIQSDTLQETELLIGGTLRPNGDQASRIKGHTQSKAAPRSVSLDFVVNAHTHPFLSDHTIQGTPVVPMVFVVEWFARVAAQLHPGLSQGVLHDLNVLRGVRVKDFQGAGLALRVTCSEGATGDACELQLCGLDGTLYYRAKLRPKVAGHPKTMVAPVLEAWNGRTVYGDVLFHGPRFQVIDALEGVSSTGIAGSLRGVRLSGWGEGWQTDPAAMDGGLQLALLWSRESLGGASLPMRIGEVHLGGPAVGPVRCVLTGTRQDPTRATSDLSFLDEEGHVMASMLQVETVLVPAKA